ncbi:MAG: universal stress protein [Proteobacteria bacterium]|nr:universal stress protein [Pseudomonadota bacterium]MCP4918476.1 universal stress protein [Pseudomonadota bacterium]
MYAHAAWLHDLDGASVCEGPLVALLNPGADLAVVHASANDGDHGRLAAVVEHMRNRGLAARAVLSAEPVEAWCSAWSPTDGVLALGRGSQTARVLRESGCPVLVCGDSTSWGTTLSRVLVPFDPGIRVGVVPEALRLGIATGATLTFLHVHDVNETCEPDETLAVMRAAVREQVEPHQEGRLKVRFEVGIGDGAGPAINAAAQSHDLVVLGSRGRRGLSRFFLGSVAEVVARDAPVPVLVVRPR